MPIGDDERLCETASSWRLLSGGFAPGFSHRPYNTTSREPPPQISTAVRASPFPPPQPFDPFVIHRPPLPPQQPRDPPIPIPPIRSRQRDDPFHHPRLIIRHPRPMPVRGPRLTQHTTGPPLGDVQLVANYGHRLPASRRAQKFPEVTSLRIALSRAWSATSFLSRVFSRSSSLSRLA